MSYKPSHKFPKARKGQVGDLFIDGYDIYRWKGTRGNVRIMTNLKTGTDTELEHNRVEFMTHVAEGEVIFTGAEPFHIVGVSQAPGFAITYTIDDRTVEVSAPAVQFCADLAERRAAAYGKPGERRPEGDPNVTRVRAIMRETQLPSVMINRDPDRTRGAHAVVHHNADLDITKLPDSLIVVAYGGRWVAVNLKEEPAVEPDEEAVADALRDMTADEFTDALDAVADALLDEVGEPDLAADAALPDELDEILDRPSSFGDFVRGRILSEDDLSDDDLPAADEEELPPGEPQPLPEDVARYQKGDRLWTPAGREYRVMSVDRDFVRVKHESGELYIPHAEMPSLLREHPVLAAAVEPNWEDEIVRISAELIQARQRIAQLEDELARLHDESRDTEPLAPETVEAAANASQEFGLLEGDPLTFKSVRTESVTLWPVDILDMGERARRDREIEELKNELPERWYTVFEDVTPVHENGQPVKLLHTIRLERNITIDNPPSGDGQPDQRDVLDQAIDVVDSYAPDEQSEDADSEDIVTETDLAPVTSSTPVSDAIDRYGLAAVMESQDADIKAAFHKGAGMWAPRIDLGLGEVSS